MQFQIKEIVLWPRDERFEPRRLKFEPGKVNVISGHSRTGKSAVIPIVDYCLGSKSCAIPVETIRKACSWFGIVVKTPNGEKLFARREPGEHRITDEMYVAEAAAVKIPKTLEKNTGADKVRQMLNELSGLSNLDFSTDPTAPSGFEAKVSFRDLAAFNFQPQNVIANPEVLFFKTNTWEHREKLRKIFPYILGAITPAILAKEHELNRLRQELRRKERELKDAREVSANWFASLQSRVSEGRELGLIGDHLAADASQAEMIAALEEVIKRSDATVAVTSETINEAVRETGALEAEENAVSTILSGLRQRLTEMNRARQSVTSYSEALQVQRKRLKITDWLLEQTSEASPCVLCGAEHQPAEERLQELSASLRNIESSIGDFGEIPAAFDREMQRVQTEVSDTTEKLKAIRARRDALMRRSSEAQNLQFAARKADRYIGNTENALDLYRRLGSDAALASEVEALRASVQKLQGELRDNEINARKQRALQSVNQKAGRLLPDLDAERPDAPISLEVDDLTIKVVGPDRDDYLAEIGSGSNWLSYHVAVMLALHQFFLTLPSSPVPSFLVIDQPSQVYFPTKGALRQGEEPVEPDFTKSDDADVSAVQKIIGAMGKVVGAAAGQLQVIVLDHAPKWLWGSLPNVVEVEEWRDGHTKLVPMEWLGGPSEQPGELV